MKENVKIIGAGPGGLAAAIVLRTHGFPVTVYEHGNYQGKAVKAKNPSPPGIACQASLLTPCADNMLDTNYRIT